jgi:hypothetical protein
MTRSKKTAGAAAILLAGSLVACNDGSTHPSVTPLGLSPRRNRPVRARAAEGE